MNQLEVLDCSFVVARIAITPKIHIVEFFEKSMFLIIFERRFGCIKRRCKSTGYDK